jgi:hypothetical protein
MRSGNAGPVPEMGRGKLMTAGCSRPTKAGKPCRYSALDWSWAAASGLPDPAACRVHMNPLEVQAWWDGEESRYRHAAEEAAKIMPACWSWPVTQHDRQQVATAELAEDEELRITALDEALAEWQDGRCAVCGGTIGRLVNDHGHGTGNLRGLLCESCNSAARVTPGLKTRYSAGTG